MDNQFTIRNFRAEDKPSLFEVLSSNTPQYFSFDEKQDFDRYLDKEIEAYFVVENKHQIVGCGGINLNLEQAHGVISWGMIHADFHRQNIGGELLKYRLAYLIERYRLDKITVRTSQMVYLFYQKHGFELIEIKKDFWAQGIDLYLMEIDLHK